MARHNGACHPPPGAPPSPLPRATAPCPVAMCNENEPRRCCHSARNDPPDRSRFRVAPQLRRLPSHREKSHAIQAEGERSHPTKQLKLRPSCSRASNRPLALAHRIPPSKGLAPPPPPPPVALLFLPLASVLSSLWHVAARAMHWRATAAHVALPCRPASRRQAKCRSPRQLATAPLPKQPARRPSMAPWLDADEEQLARPSE